MGFFKKLKALLYSPKQPRAEKQLRTANKRTGKTSDRAPSSVEPLPSVAKRSKNARRAKKAKKQVQIRVSTDSENGEPSPEPWRKSSYSSHKLSKKTSQSQHSRSRNNVKSSSAPHPAPPLPLDIPLPARLPLRPKVNRVSSADYIVQGYSSRTTSPERDSIFGHRSSQKSSPASTISAFSTEHAHFKNVDASASAASLPVIPEKIHVERTTSAGPFHEGKPMVASRLSAQDVNQMRAKVYAGSHTSSHDGDIETGAHLTPKHVTASLSGLQGKQSLSARITHTAGDISKSIIKPKIDDSPPPIDKSRARCKSVRIDLFTSSTSAAPTSKGKAPIIPTSHPTEGHFKQSVPARTRADSFTVTPIPSFCPEPTFVYVRREHDWRTTAARFNAIFDAIPSNAAGACRENPKLYRIRRHRALVQLGLMEHELVATPNSPKGQDIMKQLDKLEETMERERWEAKLREIGGANGKGEQKARKMRVKVAVAGAHCVNDARVRFAPVDKMQVGKGRFVVYQPVPNREEMVGGKGKGKVVG